MSTKKFRNVAFTLNNYTEEEIKSLKECDKFSFIIFGKEVCPTTGTPHLQGYVELKDQMRLSGLKKINNRAHWFERYENATAEDNIVYCSKANDVYRAGEPKKQGERTDLKKISKAIYEGKMDRESLAIEDPAVYARYYKAWETCDYLRMRKSERRWQTVGLWIGGLPGTGKSHLCFDDLCGNVPIEQRYVWQGKNGWWDGYKGQPIIIINDIHTYQIEYDVILNVVDKWPYNVPIRGKEAVPLLARLVICTSPLKLEDMRFDRQFHDEDSQGQVMRRFTQIYLSQKWSGNTRQTTEYLEALKIGRKAFSEAFPDKEESKSVSEVEEVPLPLAGANPRATMNSYLFYNKRK